MLPFVRKPEELAAYKISEKDTNYFVFLNDPLATSVDCTFIIEIYQAHGKTPPNVHQFATEFFYILKGKGRAYSGEHTLELSTGDFLHVPPGNQHIVENLLDEKLYALCLMVPNEEFAQLIHSGFPVELDAEDIRVLTKT
jgi:mannose-6-phosphate isomerase-like protein (cupin superfamily)